MNTTTRPESDALQVLEPARYDRQPATTSASLILQGDAMERIFKFADMMSHGIATVPKHLQGKPADCLAVVMQATQWGMNPFAVAQKTHIVNGTLGYEAQLVNAVLQATGSIRGEFRYEYRGTAGAIECRVGAVIAGNIDVTWGEWLSENTVTTKNSPLWKTNVKQQLGYLQVKNWARAFRPAAILGVYTADELETPPPEEPKPRQPAPLAERVDRQAYPEADFTKNLPSWRAAIAAGKKTADQIIAMVQSKGELSEAQKQAIQAPEPAKKQEPEAQATQTDTGAPKVTYAMVASALNAAKDADALAAAADLIGEVADPEQRKELSALFDARANKAAEQQ